LTLRSRPGRTLAAQESQRLVFNLPATGQPLWVALPADALTVDDQVELLPPVRRQRRCQAWVGVSMARGADACLKFCTPWDGLAVSVE